MKIFHAAPAGAVWARRISLFLVFLAAFWANQHTPLWGHDYCRTQEASLLGALAAARAEYFSWTGRFVPTALTYFLLSTGWQSSMVYFNLLNALIFSALVAVILGLARYAAASPDAKAASGIEEFFNVIAVALMLWWLPRTIAEVALWKTGAIGYLWPLAGELFLFLIVWRLLAALLGNFLESLSLLWQILLAGFALLAWWKNRKAFAPIFLIAIAHAVGAAVLFIGPGSYARLAAFPQITLRNQIEGWIGFFAALFSPYWLVAIGLIGLVYLRSGRSLRESFRLGSAWIFAALAGVYMAVLLGTPRDSWTARTSFPASVLLMCYLTAAWLNRPRTQAKEFAAKAALVVLAGISLAVSARDLRMLERVSERWKEALLRQRQEHGAETDARLPLVTFHGRTLLIRGHLFFEGIHKEPDFYVNRCYAKAMGVRTVQGFSQQK